MTDKIHGQIASGEHLTSNIDFWTIYTAHDLDETGTQQVNSATPVEANNLDRIIQFIGQRAQAVMVSVIETGTVTMTDAPQSLGSQFDAAGILWTLKFATEHTGAWDDTASAVNNLEESLDQFALPFATNWTAVQTAPDSLLIDTDSATVRNTRVVKSLTL